MKKFLITIDTEGDNLWDWREGQAITTINTKYLQRFQDLCNKYSFKPVWLTNYEMIMDDNYLSFIKNVINTNTGELGMHLHAWNNPPIFQLDNHYQSAPYLIEYPTETMEEKIKYLTELIESRTGYRPVTHRAGRWATDERYFELLAKYGYKYDCSYTPYTSWENCTGRTINSKGSDYSKIRNKKYVINTKEGDIVEFPATILKTKKKYPLNNFKGLVKSIVYFYKSEYIWLRPNGNNLNEMLKIVKKAKQDSNINYIMFMIHSSELMPGGSPTFKTNEDIEKLYSDLEVLFKTIFQDFEGATISEIGDTL